MTRTNRLLLGAALLLAATSLRAQNASYTIVGTSCTTGRISPQIGPVPFAVQGVPRLGSAFTVVTESSAGYPWGTRRRVFLLTGTSNTSVGGVPLPFDVSTLRPGAPWCGLLRTSNEVVMNVPLASSHTTPAQIRIAVPNTPSMAGVSFFQQVVSVEFSSFGPPFNALALSAGGHGVIGF